jgi:hypothetical protein
VGVNGCPLSRPREEATLADLAPIERRLCELRVPQRFIELHLEQFWQRRTNVWPNPTSFGSGAM